MLLPRAAVAVPTLLLATLSVPGSGAGQTHPGSLATRAACHRLLARWTLAEADGRGAFHLRPAVAARLGPGASPVDGATDLGAGGRIRRGTLRAGESVPSEDGFRYPGPVEEPRRSGGTASLVVRESAGWLALVVDAGVARSLDVPVAQLAGRIGGVVVSAGREGPWPGHGCSGGLVLSGRGRADGVGVDAGPLDLPLVGGLSLSGFLGTLPEGSTDNPRPLFLVQRAVLPLASDVRLGLTRAAVFGGEQTTVPLTPRAVGLTLLGVTDVRGKDSDFENQVASVDLSWRVPVGASAARLHMEYAADDAGFAFLRVPAVALGAEFVTRREAGGFRTLGAELVWIAPSNRTYPEWYRHGALAWGWTDRGELLGHDLGGEGWGLRLAGFTAAGDDAWGARVLVGRRGGENLLAPRARGWGVEIRSEGRKALASVGGRDVLASWHLEAGRLGGHGLLAGGAGVLVRF